jgi:hypothetical protein
MIKKKKNVGAVLGLIVSALIYRRSGKGRHVQVLPGWCEVFDGTFLPCALCHEIFPLFTTNGLAAFLHTEREICGLFALFWCRVNLSFRFFPPRAASSFF